MASKTLDILYALHCWTADHEYDDERRRLVSPVWNALANVTWKAYQWAGLRLI